MAVVLPILAALLLYTVFRRLGYAWRESIMASAIAWGTFLTLITEALSALELITPHAVIISWIGICVFALVGILILKHRSDADRFAVSVEAPFAAGPETEIKILILAAVVIAALVAVVALLAPPSSWDAMQTYLPRVMFWISNRSVAFYPTPDYLQLVFAPWPSFAMMHSILLFGTDRLVNLFQVLSLLGCAIAVSIIARELGAGARGQALAAVVSVTIPQGILEASGTLNSYIVSFWIAAAISFLLLWKDKPRVLTATLVGLAIGLALLSKGHAYIYLPFMLIVCWWMCAPRDRLALVKLGLVFAGGVLLINAPTLVRNYELTGSPLGLPLPEPFRQSMMMTDFRPSAVIANVVRHMSVHVGVPLEAVNVIMDKSILYALNVLGIDPDYSIYEGDKFSVIRPSRHELLAGNAIHFALIFWSFVLIIFGRARPASREVRLYAGGIAVSFVAVSATIIWQTTTGRYHLPLFVLSSPLVALCLERYLNRAMLALTGGGLIAVGVLFATTNRTRALLPLGSGPNVYQERPYLYFADLHEADYPIHNAVAAAVKKGTCSDVALDSVLPKGVFRDSKGSLYVYPILALMNQDGLTRRVRYTGVANLTARYAKPRQDPCAVICFNCAQLPEKWNDYRRIGGRASVFGNIVLFSKDGDLLNLP